MQNFGFIILILSFFLFENSFSAFLDGYQYKQEISIQNDNHTSGILEYILEFNTGLLNENYDYILFKDEDGENGETLKHFIDKSNSNEEKTVFWIRGNQYLSQNSTKIFMYYGKLEDTRPYKFLVPTAGDCTDGAIRVGSKNGLFLKVVPEKEKIGIVHDELLKHEHEFGKVEMESSDTIGSFNGNCPAFESHEHSIVSNTFSNSFLIPKNVKVNFCKKKDFSYTNNEFLLLSEPNFDSEHIELFEDVQNQEYFIRSLEDGNGFVPNNIQYEDFVHEHNFQVDFGSPTGITSNIACTKSESGCLICLPMFIPSDSHTHSTSSNDPGIPQFVSFAMPKIKDIIVSEGHYDRILDFVDSTMYVLATEEIAGFEDISSDYFDSYIRFGNSIQTGGNNEHYHEFVSEDTQDLVDRWIQAGGTDVINSGHSHSLKTDTIKVELPYYGIKILRKMEKSEVSTLEFSFVGEAIYSEVEVFNPVLLLVIIFLVFISILIVILVVLILFFMFLKKQKIKFLDLIQFLRGKKKLIIGDEIDQALVESTHHGNSVSSLRKSSKTPQLKILDHLFKIEFDDIQIVEKIGKGGSNSVIFKAIYDSKEVGFKCFKVQDFLDNDDKFKEFESEASLMLSLNHPNCLQTYGVTMKEPRIGIVMEYCTHDLKQFIIEKKKRFTLRKKLKILHGIAAGCAYLHGRKVIHRDLKCENVLLKHENNDYVPKLIDFGLSRALDSFSQTKTKRIGTSFYMPPQITLGEKYTEKCDVFSFAIMMFIVLTGNFQPYGTKTVVNIERKIANTPTYRPKTYLLHQVKDYKKVEKWLTKLMIEGWKHEEDERPTFSKVKRILQDAIDSL